MGFGNIGAPTVCEAFGPQTLLQQAFVDAAGISGLGTFDGQMYPRMLHEPSRPGIHHLLALGAETARFGPCHMKRRHTVVQHDRTVLSSKWRGREMLIRETGHIKIRNV